MNMQDFSCYVSAVQRNIPKTNVLQKKKFLQQVGFHESKLYVSKLCVSKLCVSKLCVSELCVCVCVCKLCVCE